jgi:hypothetical protein
LRQAGSLQLVRLLLINSTTLHGQGQHLRAQHPLALTLLLHCNVSAAFCTGAANTVQGVIFVVDAADGRRVDEAAAALSSVLQHPDLLVSEEEAYMRTYTLHVQHWWLAGCCVE